MLERTKLTATAVALGVGAMMMGSSAEAALIDHGTCAVGGVTVTGFAPTGDAFDCAGAFEGNDTGNSSDFLAELNAGNIFANFGSGDLGSVWTLLGKSDDGQPSVTVSGTGQTGTWQATGVQVHTVVTVKASDCFSAFLFSPLTTSNVSGTFDVSEAGITVPQGQSGTCYDENGPVPGISHLSVFVAGGFPPPGPDPEINPIPLPAAGWLLIGGLGALAAVRRRRKAT